MLQEDSQIDANTEGRFYQTILILKEDSNTIYSPTYSHALLPSELESEFK